jgi:hypothetical protein
MFFGSVVKFKHKTNTNKRLLKKKNSVMQKELITLLKGVGVVVVGVLVANAIEKKFMSTKTLMPIEKTS